MRIEPVEVNRDYYGVVSSGREDYWKRMAAPRARVERLTEMLQRAAPTSIVDLGCGNGSLILALAEVLYLHRVAAIDLSPAQIEVNGRFADDIEWIAYDLTGGEDIPAELAGGFEAVVTSEVIEHVDSPALFLDRARAFATPGGRLYLSTQSGSVHETERRVGHVRHFTPETMRSLLELSGWRPVAVWNEGFPFHDLSKWYANLNPDASMKRFGEESYGWSERLICFGLRGLFRLNSKRKGSQLYAIAVAG